MQETLFHISVIFLFLIVFLEASISKFVEGKVPDWFQEQFASSWLAKFPLAPMWWCIAIFELVIAGTMVVALVKMEFSSQVPNFWTGYGLIGSMFLFAILCFGQRVSFDYAGAANSFYYAALTGGLWYVLQHVK